MITKLLSVDPEMLGIEERTRGNTCISQEVGNRVDFMGAVRVQRSGTGRSCQEEEGIQGKTAKMEGYLKDGMKTKCCGNILKYMKLTLTKSPNNSGDTVPTGHPLSPNESCSSRSKLHPIELLSKGVPYGKPSKHLGCC